MRFQSGGHALRSASTTGSGSGCVPRGSHRSPPSECICKPGAGRASQGLGCGQLLCARAPGAHAPCSLFGTRKGCELGSWPRPRNGQEAADVYRLRRRTQFRSRGCDRHRSRRRSQVARSMAHARVCGALTTSGLLGCGGSTLGPRGAGMVFVDRGVTSGCSGCGSWWTWCG